jgi:predicted nucleic acid-binding protein
MATEFVIFDTDILIDAGLHNEQAVSLLFETEQRTKLAISVITEMEMIVGCRSKVELQNVERFLERFTVVKLNSIISDKAVELLKRYRASHGLKMPDALIAATAIISQVPLITKNQRDFRFIEKLDLPEFS